MITIRYEVWSKRDNRPRTMEREFKDEKAMQRWVANAGWTSSGEEECDHDWIDESHAGPDSGNIDMTCRKCGKVCYANLY